MMINDNERREVARRLREYVDLPDDWRADTYSGFYVEKCVFGDVERHRESELFARIADLIEPSCDRDALLTLADDLDRMGDGSMYDPCISDEYGIARRIREACGEVEG